MATILEAKSLKKKFHIFKNMWFSPKIAVDGVSLHVDEGEIVGLLGPNGAGKSTSLKMISGDITPDEGSVFFDGMEVTDWPMYKRCLNGLGYLAQENTLFKNLSVENNLIGVMQMLGYSKQECRERCDELVKMFDLEPIRNSMAARISGGERRRLEVARALAKQPKLIILDEPFAGVDPIAIGTVQSLIRDLRQKWGIAILITDHNVPPIIHIADRAYVIADGKVIFDGGVNDLIHNPEVKKVYLGENIDAFSLKQDIEGKSAIHSTASSEAIPENVQSNATAMNSAASGEMQSSAAVEVKPQGQISQSEQTDAPQVEPGNAAPEETDLSELLKSVHTISAELDKSVTPSETLATFIQKSDAEAQTPQDEPTAEVQNDSSQTVPQRKTLPTAPAIKPFRRKN